MPANSDRDREFDPAALRRKYLEERDKRLRPDMDRQYVDAAEKFEHFGVDPYVEPGFQRATLTEDVNAAVIGGGFGGLLTAARLRDRGVDSVRIIEEGGDFGGTWYWNRYPGVRCDIESYIYMPLLEEVGTMPTERYATGAEIFAHCQAIGRHYGLYERALFQTRVTRIAWDAEASRWIISTHRGDTIRARFVSVSQGPLSKAKLPGIPGIDRFQGVSFHSSRWNYDYTGGDQLGGQIGLAGKTVAVIGTGATAIQIVPKLAEHAERLYLFQRTPSAIDERNNAPTDVDWFRSQPSGWQRERMDNFLTILCGMPHAENMVGDRWTDFWTRFVARMSARRAAGDKFHPGEVMQEVDYEKMEEIRQRVAATITHPETMEVLKPWYNYLCKRPLYSDEFLHALNQPNVTLVDTQGSGVQEITPTGLVAAGKSFDADCIIFATGFDVGAAAFKAGRYELIGRDGVSLEEKWRQGVRTVHGIQMAGFPNFYIVGGTLQGTTHFNFTHVLDMQATHAAELIARCLREHVAAMEVTGAAEDRWLRAVNEKHVDHQQFYEDCTPGFLNNEGDFKDRPTFVGGTYGGGPIEYEKIITQWRSEGIARDTVRDYENDDQIRRRVTG
jgi:cyclohexanone monooxygenase